MNAMFLKQYYLGCLAHASYLIADETSASAIVVDPQRDIEQYLTDAEKLGVTIRHVFLSHFHADFLAGHLELRDRCGADIRLGARGKAEYAFVPMKDGDSLTFPGLRVQVLETPGHTIESISILLFDLRLDSAKPYAVLTGDTLFIGDVGRPDLRASLGWTAQELGGHLYDSLHDKLLPLPDETLVYPAHGAGSLCGKQLSSDTVSTLGDQRRLNYALQPMTKDQFVSLVTADQPDAPSYFTYDAVLNTRERVHDIGIFKAVGMTPRQTTAMAISWVGAIGLVAGVMAVPLGVALHHEILPAMAGSVGLRLPASFLNVYGPTNLLALATAGLLIAIVGALAPATWAARIHTATALHTE